MYHCFLWNPGIHSRLFPEACHTLLTKGVLKMMRGSLDWSASVSSFEEFELNSLFINYFLHQTAKIYKIANLRPLCVVFQKPENTSMFVSRY